MEKSRTPLVLWFQAIYLHTRMEGISATRLETLLDITYKTAWLICHKIRDAMSQYDAEERLRDDVRINCAQYGSPYNPTVYRHPQQHPLLVGASLDPTGKITYLKIKQVAPEDLYEDVVISTGRERFIQDHVDAVNSKITAVIKPISPHRNLQLIKIGRQASRWMNLVFQGIGAKHLQAYLDQYCFLAHHAGNFNFLLQRCVMTRVRTYKMLVSKPTNAPVTQNLIVHYPQYIRGASKRRAG